jgi:ATP-dependent Clp protease protease subunit
MKVSSNKKFWDIKAQSEKIGDIYIYGSIVRYRWDDADTTAMSFKEDLEALGDIDTLNIYVNSPGGSVFQAQAIYNIIKRHKSQKTAYVDGLAASAASFLVMAADKIVMPKNATMMVHNPIAFVIGNAKDLRHEADALDKITVGMIEAYLSHTGDKLTEDKLKELLDAETWLTAQEAYDYGLADEITEVKDVAACVDSDIFALYKNVPEAFKAPQTGGDNSEELKLREQIVAESKATIEKVGKVLRF